MAELRIPQQQRQALQTFVGLSPDSTQALLRALQDAQPALTPARLARQVARSVELPVVEIRQILQLIGSLLIAAHASKRPKESVAADVARTIAEERLTGNELTPNEIEAFKSKLLSFLSLRVLEITAKATDVMLQHKNIFSDARVLTDLRPIFAEDDLSPVACVIIHNLEIQTFSDSNRVSYFAALDSGDLRRLQTVIERAIRKETTLKETINRTGLSQLETEQET